MGKILTLANQKGGVGKTTTVINLAAALMHQGKRVLLVDNDPQANLSFGLGVGADNPDGLVNTLTDVMRGIISARDAIHLDSTGTLPVIPSHINLIQAEQALVNAFSRETILRDKLLDLVPEYDFILIDTGPSLGLLTNNALVATDYVIVPVSTQAFSLQGLHAMTGHLDQVSQVNPRLRLLGILATLHRKVATSARQVLESLGSYNQPVFETTIPQNVDLANAPFYQSDIFNTAPTSEGAKAYQRLAAEVLTLIEGQGVKRG